MKIGYINYLNCYPFYHDMFERAPIPGVEVVPDYPESLNRMIAAGELAMGPVSAAAYATLQGEACIIPDFCLSSIGYVRSVVLQSSIPIEELQGKRVGLSAASRTSVVLLKTLLKNFYHLDVVYEQVPPDRGLAGCDAALVIGNDAMVETRNPAPYIYDLGDLWLRKTGFPVVFAVFVVRNEAWEREPQLVREVIGSYRKSLSLLLGGDRELVRKAAEKYANVNYDAAHYYTLLKFEFTDELKKALLFYFNQAASLGLLPAVERLEFLGRP